MEQTIVAEIKYYLNEKLAELKQEIVAEIKEHVNKQITELKLSIEADNKIIKTDFCSVSQNIITFLANIQLAENESKIKEELKDITDIKADGTEKPLVTTKKVQNIQSWFKESYLNNILLTTKTGSKIEFRKVFAPKTLNEVLATEENKKKLESKRTELEKIKFAASTAWTILSKSSDEIDINKLNKVKEQYEKFKSEELIKNEKNLNHNIEG